MQVLVVFAFILAVTSAGIIITGPLATHISPRGENVSYKPKDRIANGADVKDGEIPYQVAISFHGPQGGWFCGGSIIGSNWLLTAAQCTDRATSAIAALGSTNRTSPKVTHNVENSNFVQHKSYDPNVLRNNIALIRMPTTEFNTYINKIELPTISSAYSTYNGDIALATGWGKTSDTAELESSIMQKAYLTVIDNYLCAQTYGSLIVGRGVLCTAISNKTSTCNGDYGGPLVDKKTNKQIGISSALLTWHSVPCQKDVPAGFTRVTNYLDWIKEITGIFY